jgi:hypothetical protein
MNFGLLVLCFALLGTTEFAPLASVRAVNASRGHIRRRRSS